MERQRLEQIMLQQDLEENRKLKVAQKQLKEQKKREMRALYQERGSSEEDEDEEEDDEDFLDKMKNKMSGLFNQNKKTDVDQLKKQANQEFLQQSIKSYKYSKNSLLGQLETNGTMEEYDFTIPQKHLESESTSSSSLEGAATNLSEQTLSARSKQRQAQRFQVHCIREWRI